MPPTRLLGLTAAVCLLIAYAYNAANQRVAVTNADETFWAYGYDQLGQLTNGWRYWAGGSNVLGQTFEYAFDDIGNRTTTQTGGDDTGGTLRTATYTANLLNQLTNRTVPGYVEVGGLVESGADVAVNGSAAERQDDYFRREVAVTNSSAALAQWLNTVATNSTGTSVVARLSYVPQTPETFTHDADGNLTQDGLWRYTWDAENRLTRIETRTNAVTDTAYWKRIDCDYDYAGRRVRLRVSSWDTGGGSYHLTGSKRFFYDGWNSNSKLEPTIECVLNHARPSAVS
jgi:YD repeat-containing protein